MNSTPFALNCRSPVLPPPGGVTGPPLGSQHLNSAGPGHRPVFVVPVQLDDGRQLPPDPHSGLMQHFTLSGSLGQKPERKEPSPAAQFAVVIQTPGVPSILQGPLRAARESGRRVRRIERDNIVNCLRGKDLKT